MGIYFFCEKPDENANCKWLGKAVTLQITIAGITGEFKGIRVCKKSPKDGSCFHRLTRLQNMIVKKEKEPEEEELS